MALATLTQRETHCQAMLTSFNEYEKLIENHPDTKKEMDLVQASIVQIGQLVQNLPKVNGNSTKWKQLVNRAEANRHTFCKFPDIQVLFIGLFHMYAATYKKIKGSFQQSSKELGQENDSQPEENK
jgi:hypothetical protein